MLWAATAVAIAAAAAPSPQQLVLAPADVPAGYRQVEQVSGATAPNAYRAAYASGSSTRLVSVAVVFADARGAAAEVAAPTAGCGRTGTTRKLPAPTVGAQSVLCGASLRGFDGFTLAWRDGRVFATVSLVGRRGQVSAALALRLARAQEARIAHARGAGPGLAA